MLKKKKYWMIFKIKGRWKFDRVHWQWMLKISEMHPSWVRHNRTVNLIIKDTLLIVAKIPLIIPIIVLYIVFATFTQVTIKTNNAIYIYIIKTVKKIRIIFNKFSKMIYEIYICSNYENLLIWKRVILRNNAPLLHTHTYFRTQYDECNKFNAINNYGFYYSLRN